MASLEFSDKVKIPIWFFYCVSKIISTDGITLWKRDNVAKCNKYLFYVRSHFLQKVSEQKGILIIYNRVLKNLQ